MRGREKEYLTKRRCKTAFVELFCLSSSSLRDLVKFKSRRCGLLKSNTQQGCVRIRVRKKPYSSWFLRPKALNIGYLDQLGRRLGERLFFCLEVYGFGWGNFGKLADPSGLQHDATAGFKRESLKRAVCAGPFSIVTVKGKCCCTRLTPRPWCLKVVKLGFLSRDNNHGLVASTAVNPEFDSFSRTFT